MRRSRLALLGAVVVGVLLVSGQARGFVASATTPVERVSEIAMRVIERIIDRVFDRSEDIQTAVHERHADQSSEFEWTGRISAGEVIEIKGVNGPIRVELASGNEVEVEAEKTARRSDPSEVRIEVVEHSDGTTICAVYPGRDNSCEPGSRGRNSVRNNDVKVSFTVRVPEGVDFHGKTVNGDVEVEGLESDVIVETVNGDVEIETTGFAEASTVNGSIHAEMGSAWDRGLEFNTVNGSIELDVPDDVSADVDAKWVNGSLDLDLPMNMHGRVTRRSAKGTLGDGGPRLELSTVNGSIRIY